MDRYSISSSESGVLSNKLGITDVEKINEEEFVGFVQAAQHAIDAIDTDTVFSLEYLYQLHRDALGHLYDFAGKSRTVDMSKGDFTFPAARYLAKNLKEFEDNFLTPINDGIWTDEHELLDILASMHAELLYIHPFREGNGRTIRLFTELIFLAKTGRKLSLDNLHKRDNLRKYISAVQQAAVGEYSLMQDLFRKT